MGLINIIHAYKCIVRIYIYLVNLGYSTGLSVEAWVTILPVPLNRIQNHVRTPKKYYGFEKKYLIQWQLELLPVCRTAIRIKNSNTILHQNA